MSSRMALSWAGCNARLVLPYLVLAVVLTSWEGWFLRG
jgi:hypothetical protein